MMIYFLLTLFFASLFSIMIMLGRKLAKLEREQVFNHQEVLFELPYLKEIKQLTIEGIKKHGYAGLVKVLRFHIQFSNFLKGKYEKAKIKIKNIHVQNTNGDSLGKKEVSKFLKIIGDYKQKIREIKHKIKREENL